MGCGHWWVTRTPVDGPTSVHREAVLVGLWVILQEGGAESRAVGGGRGGGRNNEAGRRIYWREVDGGKWRGEYAQISLYTYMKL